MKLTFIGADHEVTGSCHMLTVGDKNIIVDCGMEQGPDYYVNQQIPVKPSDIDAILVTHAHIDHTGLIPLLVKNGFKGPIYSTAATAQLCKIMLQDSAHIQEFEAEWKNRKARRAGNPEVEPMYTVQDALDAAELFIPCAYSTKVDVCAGIQARFTDVGHLLGSACIEVWATEGNTTKKVLFSGDVGNTDQPILKDPQTVDEADYVLIESTYGDREHEAEKPDYVGDFTAILRDTFLRGGNVVVPSFAVGRTQELLYFIRE
ncbi:MAG: MBL fold metallo-hydrolase, partial [Lachnospiraceae bacterium]|nr:MBL fold metallo-hydrolase [Lachnospiraceae bacterium]